MKIFRDDPIIFVEYFCFIFIFISFTFLSSVLRRNNLDSFGNKKTKINMIKLKQFFVLFSAIIEAKMNNFNFNFYHHSSRHVFQLSKQHPL